MFTIPEAELDVGLFLDIYTGLKDINDTLGQIQDSASHAQQPVFYPYADSVIIPSNGLGVVKLTGPDPGHFWYVRRIIAGGLTPTTTAAGRADIFVSAADLRSFTSLGQMSLADWRDQTVNLPAIGSYSRGYLTLRREQLYVVFSGATPGQEYVAGCNVEDFEEAAVKQAWAV